jgi:hypothetical protein
MSAKSIYQATGRGDAALFQEKALRDVGNVSLPCVPEKCDHLSLCSRKAVLNSVPPDTPKTRTMNALLFPGLT